MGAAKKMDDEIVSYLHLLNDQQKAAVLTVVKTFAAEDNSAFLETQPQSLDAYNQDLDEALAQAQNGNYITQEEMERRAAQW